MKAEIVADQKAALEERRDVACRELRETRDGLYRELLDYQQEMRLNLHGRQEAGLDNAQYLDRAGEAGARREMGIAFRDAANAVSRPQEGSPVWEMETDAPEGSPRPESSGMKSPAGMGTNVGEGIGFGILGLLGGLADGLVGAKPEPRPRRVEPDAPRKDPFDAVIDETRKRQQKEREEADAEWRKRQGRSYGE
jgi:hypothetical protein